MSETDQDAVLCKVRGFAARITLNRPEKRNALNDAVIDGLKAALRRAESDEGVRVIVIDGAGKDFCSGADLAALQKIAESSVYENLEDARRLASLFLEMRQASLPIVAAVRGKALAGGCGLATACDIVLASEGARFGYPEVRIGFVPAMVMAILRRNLSEKRAFELITSGAEISARRAEEIGLLNHCFADDSFDLDVEQYIARFEKVSRTAVALSKKLLYQMDGMSFGAALEAGASINAIARTTEDCQQGIATFLQTSAKGKATKTEP